jgi:hypothetical protein
MFTHTGKIPSNPTSVTRWPKPNWNGKKWTPSASAKPAAHLTNQTPQGCKGALRFKWIPV